MRKPHTTAATALLGVMLAFTAAAPGAFAKPGPQAPVFPSAVPAQPGAVTGDTPAVTAARAQERYLTSYGNPKPLARPAAPVDNGGADWAAIGISLGATCLLVGAVITLVSRTRRHTRHMRVAA
jgi:hypothetical protein